LLCFGVEPSQSTNEKPIADKNCMVLQMIVIGRKRKNQKTKKPNTFLLFSFFAYFKTNCFVRNQIKNI
jgi:hypothetical protein